MIRQIPNIITLLNLVCGVLSIKYSFAWNLELAAFLIFLAAIFDFFDGASARLLKVHSEIGKQLDSLADLISFGLAPGIILLQLFKKYGVDADIQFVFLFIPVFSAIRLANFNIDDRQTKEFIGLPTPANGFFWAGLVFVNLESLFPVMTLPILCMVMSFLLVSEIKLFSLKFSSLKWQGNQVRILFLLIALILFIRLLFQAIPIIVLLYILISIINFAISKKA